MQKGSITIFAIALLLLFIAASGLTYKYFLKDDKEAAVGTSAIDAVKLIVDSESDLIFLDLIARQSAYDTLNDTSLKWFNKNCKIFENYVILNEEPCIYSKEESEKSFFSFYESNFNKYIINSKIKSNYNYDHELSNKIKVKGIALYSLDYSKSNVTYSVKPDFNQEINFNFTLLPSIVEESLSKKACIKETSYNSLTDSPDKITKACNFSQNLAWSIKKKDNYALFDIKLQQINLYAKFAINLNTN